MSTAELKEEEEDHVTLSQATTRSKKKRIRVEDSSNNKTEFTEIRKHFNLKRNSTGKDSLRGSFADLNPPLLVVGDDYLIKQHIKEKERLLLTHTDRFERWWFEMENGLSILLHGYGSKFWLLETFASFVSKLNAYSSGSVKRAVEPLVCQIKGWSMKCDMRSLIDLLMREWLEWKPEKINTEKRRASGDWSLEAQCTALARDAEKTRRCLVLIVHSIDGEGLRTRETQQVLSRLAACQNVRFIASIDLVNSRLMWTRKDSTHFNFVCYDATTFVPYAVETRNFSKPAVSAKTAEVASSAKGIGYIMTSLTKTHNEILKEVASRFLKLDKSKAGVSFGELLEFCLNKLWVKNEDALRQFLREFEDHDLIRRKRVSNREYITVELPTQVIRRDILGEVLENQTEEIDGDVRTEQV